MRYRLFGPLTACVDGVDHTFTQRRERNVLAMLVASHGRPVSAERLADQLWAGEPPARGAASLQVVISQLRAVLEPGRPRRAPAVHLVSSSAGYALRAEVDAVDVWRFEADARRAAAATALDCVTSSTAALDQWAGTPYADSADTDLVQSEVARLVELRLSMIEARADALLQLGHPATVTAELAELVADHPFRERLWSRLALSQFQTLRQADALATLRTLRERLADELGVDPSPEVRALELAVLNQSPDLAARPPVPLAAETPVPRPPVEAQVPAHRLIGRTVDLAIVTEAIDRLRAGHGGSVLVSGDAGIGKSRLAAAAAAYAAAHGVAVAVGRCHEADVAPAYWPWLPVLRDLMTADAPAEVRALLDADAVTKTSDAGASALRSYDAVARLLTASGQRQPLLVVLEDLHWADASSLRLLAFVVETAAAGVLLLCTRRTAGARAPEALTAALAALARQGAARIRLEGLDVDDVSRLLGAEVGPDAQPLASAITRRTGGNPFYVIEFGRLLRSRMITDPQLVTEVAVPEGIRDVLRLRLDRLPAAARPALSISAVAGAVDPQLIATVAQASASEVFAALDAALAAGLLIEGEGGYRFGHALVRETIYADLPVGERVRLHAAVAQALAPGLAGDPEILTELAHHFWLAAPLDPRYATEALRHLKAAAQVADSRYAYVESAQLWAQAAAASAMTDAPDPLERCRLLISEGSAEMRIGAMAGAREHIGEAMAIGRAAGRWALVGEAAAALGNVGGWRWLDDGVGDDRIIAALTECVTHLPDGPLAALVLASLQSEYLTARRASDAHTCGRSSVTMARRAGDPAVLLRVLLMRALSIWGPGTYDERIALGEEMLSLPLAGELEVSALWQYGAALIQAGRPGDADPVMAQCLTAAARLRHTGSDVPLGWFRFMQAIAHDDPRSREVGDAALQLHRRSSVVSLEEMTGIYTLRTAPVGAEVPRDLMAGPAVGRNPAFRAMIAYALVEAGDLDGAVRLLGREPATDAPDFAQLASDCLQAGVYAAARLGPQVRLCLDRIRPWSGDVVLWGSADHLGAVDFFIALALRSIGDLSAARRHAAAARDLCVRVGNKPWARRARQLLTELEAGPALEDPEAMLVGRGAETRRLRALLDRTAAGSGGVVVVVGPATSGRTAMADVAARLGTRRGFDVVRATQVPGRPAGSVWAQVLRDVGAHEQAERLMGDPRAEDLDAAAVALCRSSPLMVVIDDLDETGAIELLAVLAGRVASSRLAVVVTSTEPLGVGDEVWLSPLTPAQISAITGVEDPDLVEAIWTAARGRPGPAQQLAQVLDTLDADRDRVVGLALSVVSDKGFLDLDVGLIRLLEAALLRVADDVDRARLLARLAYALLGDAAAASHRRQLINEALALARALDDPAVLAEVLDARLHALWDPAGAPDRLDSATEIVDLARRSADLARERRGLFWRFVALMELARLDEAESVLASFASQARSAGDHQDEVMALARHAMLATLSGRFDDALRLIDRVDEEGRQAGLADTGRLVGTLRGEIAGLRGEQPGDAGAADIELLREFDRRIPGHFYDATSAFLLLHHGRADDARLELDRALPHLLAGSGPRWLGAAAELADVAARTRSGPAAATLLDALAGYSGRLVVFAGANSTLGPVDHWLGVLAASLGRTDEAIGWLTGAAELAERIGARPFLAFTLSALADALSARDAVGDATRAAGLRRRAAGLARKLGMSGLDAALSPQTDVWLLRRDEDDWELRAGAERARLPDGRGVNYLRRLLAAPGQEIRSTDLAAGGAGLVTADPEPVLDDLARRTFHRRLTELETELDEADARGDEVRATLAEAERQALLAELRRASGLGVRTRRLPAEDERARVNVTRTLRATISQISTKAPLAGAHLDASVSTGRVCRYQPATGGPARWLL